MIEIMQRLKSERIKFPKFTFFRSCCITKIFFHFDKVGLKRIRTVFLLTLSLKRMSGWLLQYLPDTCSTRSIDWRLALWEWWRCGRGVLATIVHWHVGVQRLDGRDFGGVGSSKLILFCFVKISVAGQLLWGREAGVELDFLHPLLLLFLTVSSKQELRAVAGVKSEHELSLGVISGQFHTRLIDHYGRAWSFGLEEVFLVSEETHQLAAQNSVVRLPGSVMIQRWW